MQQKLGLMKQSMGSEKSEKSDQIKWKEIGIISLISVIIGLFLIHYEIFMTNDEQPPTESVNNPVVGTGVHEPSKVESWYKLGEVYEQQGQLPLSLEAFSYICQTHPLAKAQIKALLENNRYANVEVGEVFNSESLLVLYDKSRRQAVNERLLACDLAAIAPATECEKADADVITQLKCLTNPQASLNVSLWLDQPGKTQFNHQQKVTLGYQVKGLATGTTVYFTLYNVSPSGQLSMIFSEPIAVGSRYGNLTEESNVTTVKQLTLKTGTEYFKALITSQPITEANFSTAMIEKLQQFQFWQTTDLRVKVF